MGECLTHPEAPEWIGRVRSEVGVRASIVTNGALLDEARVRRLAAARVTVVEVSVPGVSRETYSRYMKLDWDTVLANILRAHAMLPDRVQVSVTVPRDAAFTADDVMAFWQPRGVRVSYINPCHNRGGFMTDERLVSTQRTGDRFCGIIVRHNFTAWDGRVLSCCHDLRGENVIGDIHRDEYAEIARRKSALLESGPNFPICPKCDDPQRADRGAIAKVQRQALAPEGQ
jgi:MoaA/NifB/PqqE/SkfB family radical SAM enzyme